MLLGARQFFERRGAPTPPLPYDAEVEYLESTGTQYVETGIIPDANTGLQLFSSSPVNTNDAYIAGERNDTSNTRWLIGWSASAKWYCGYGETITSTVDGSPILTSINYLGDGLFKVCDSYSNTLPSLSYSPSYNIRLFGSAGVVAAYTSSAVKIYSAKISVGNTLVRDFIPVRKDGVGYMYDRVSGALFRNAGTGTFTIGPDKTAWTNPYVTDGLVAMWDGVWNAGGGVHDANATTWKNLAGNNYDINCGNTGYFSGDSFVFTGAAGTIQDWGIGDESIGNLSVCGLSELNSFFAFTASRYCGRMFSILPTNNRGFQFQSGSAAMFQNWYSDPWSVAANYDTIMSDTFYNGELKPHTAGTSSWASPSYGASIGYYGGNTYPYRGRIYNLRLYSRALTAAEIAHNYAVDKERFNLP